MRIDRDHFTFKALVAFYEVAQQSYKGLVRTRTACAFCCHTRTASAVTGAHSTIMSGRPARTPCQGRGPFGWATCFRRLVDDYGPYAETLTGLHVIAFDCLMMKQAAALAIDS